MRSSSRWPDRLFESAPDLQQTTLLDIAREFKLERKLALEAALAKGTHDKTIDADMDLAFDLEARGVPSLLRQRGEVLAGAQPLEVFVEAVERERDKATALAAQGTPRSKVYAEITKSGPRAHAPCAEGRAVPADIPSRGPLNAPIVIQIFSDFSVSVLQARGDHARGSRPQVSRTNPLGVPASSISWKPLPLPLRTAPGMSTL